MQKVFLDGMGGTVGALIGFLFYFLVFIAAITSSIALLEVCTASIIDRQLDHGKEPKRRKVTLIFAICIFLIAIPVSLDALGSGGASLPAPYELLGFTGDSIKLWNDCWLDFYDMISEGILMPLGALITSILLGWVFPKVVQEECECGGQRYKGAFFFRLCFRVIIPIIMVIVLGTQVSDFFFS
jgi:NSS family neurotransmitter:Na+ symporter